MKTYKSGDIELKKSKHSLWELKDNLAGWIIISAQDLLDIEKVIKKWRESIKGDK